MQDLLRCPDAPRKHDDGMPQPDKGLQPLFDVRQDDQFVDNGIGRLGCDDAGLGHAQKTPTAQALLRMADSRALHRPFHRAGSTAGAHIHAPQAQCVADFLGVIVFVAPNRVTTPTHHQGLALAGMNNAGVA